MAIPVLSVVKLVSLALNGLKSALPAQKVPHLLAPLAKTNKASLTGLNLTTSIKNSFLKVNHKNSWHQ